MGEIADDHFDRLFDRDWHDDLDDGDWGGYLPRRKICDRCRASGLHWRHTTAGWRLHNPDGAAHECNPPSEDDFDVIEPE